VCGQATAQLARKDRTLGHHGTLADRLNHLFNTVRSTTGKPFTHQEVADACKARGTDISVAYVSLLRTGERTNPTLMHLQALANFFGVPAAYFFDDDAYHQTLRRLAEQRAIAAVRDLVDDPAVALLAVKARGLASADMLAVHAFVDSILAAESRSRGRSVEDLDGPAAT
jgi:transcriptional regulator with XRE-family HTH domain